LEKLLGESGMKSRRHELIKKIIGEEIIETQEALAEALRYLRSLDFDEVMAYEDSLLQYATERLQQIPDLRIYGTAEHKSGVAAFNVEGVHPYDLGMLLDKTGIAIRTGHHCAQPLVESFGVSGMARVSFAFYNTYEEIDIFMQQLRRCLKILRG